MVARRDGGRVLEEVGHSQLRSEIRSSVRVQVGGKHLGKESKEVLVGWVTMLFCG